MMDIRRLADDFSVSAQISVQDLQTLYDAGFRSIICNRPDGEDPGQPDAAEIAQVAHELGLEFAFLPAVTHDQLQGQAAKTRTLWEQLPKPVLAYCRSGTRCAVIWALLQIGQMPVDQIVESAAKAGYDLSGMFAL
ncbi:MAG: TIGR01244 family phosphatase [Rhodobacterales bacterium]|nr:MAG: TIGR01244 family phosphatase [Rhodobacterales bacterium]